jgi:hypothetical protein
MSKKEGDYRPTVIKVEDIPEMIFRAVKSEAQHFRCKIGNYSQKKFIIGKKEGKITFGKVSGCYILMVLFAPFKVSIKYDILIRVGEIKEPLVLKKLLNDKDQLVTYYDGLILNLREIDNSLISHIIMDMVQRPRY